MRREYSDISGCESCLSCIFYSFTMIFLYFLVFSYVIYRWIQIICYAWQCHRSRCLSRYWWCFWENSFLTCGWCYHASHISPHWWCRFHDLQARHTTGCRRSPRSSEGYTRYIPQLGELYPSIYRFSYYRILYLPRRESNGKNTETRTCETRSPKRSYAGRVAYRDQGFVEKIGTTCILIIYFIIMHYGLSRTFSFFWCSIIFPVWS